MAAVPATVSVQTLPGLVQRAASQLASASTAAEVLEARDMAGVAYDAAKKAARLAKAKGAHDELIAKAHRAQADALEIEAMAKRRLADEYDAAQDRSEINQHGGDRKTIKFESSKLESLTPDQIHEARQIRDAEEADPGVVRRAIDERLDAGQEPTKAAVRKATSNRRPQRSAAGKQLANLRKAWRESCPAVREHFLTEIDAKYASSGPIQ